MKPNPKLIRPLLELLPALLLASSAALATTDAPTAIDGLDSIPYPYSALETAINNTHRKQDLRFKNFSVVDSVLIPSGRSLQKNRTDFDDPRIVSALDTDDGAAKEDSLPLFVGYAARADQLEIIQWNKATRQFDFLIAKDYAEGKKPRLEYANRSLCITCHQAGGPIFSAGPWSETAGENKTILHELEKKFGKTYKGIQIHAAPNTSFVIHMDVNIANRFKQTNEFCAQACRNNLQCERSFLTLALLQQRRFSEVMPTLKDTLKKALQPVVWPSAEFGFPAPIIPNRDPLKNRENGGTIFQYQVTDLKTLITSSKGVADVPDDPVGANPMFGEPLALEPEQQSQIPGTVMTEVPMNAPTSLGSPSLPRPLIGKIKKEAALDYIYENIEKCTHFESSEKDLLNKIPSDQIMSWVSAGKLDSVFPDWQSNLPRAVAILSGKSQSAVQTLDSPCPGAQSFGTMPVSVEAHAQINDLSHRINSDIHSSPQKNPYAYFRRYCYACHGGVDADIEIPVHNKQDMMSFRGSDGKSILYQLYSGSMPKGRDGWTLEQSREWSKDLPDFITALGGDASLVIKSQ